MVLIFFFKAEDGIRDWSVTGVQTCALPISVAECNRRVLSLIAIPSPEIENTPITLSDGQKQFLFLLLVIIVPTLIGLRSEERRVGKELRSGWYITMIIGVYEQ